MVIFRGNAVELLEISYQFYLPEDQEKTFRFQFNAKTMELVNYRPRFHPSWTALHHHQCPHCPLDSATASQCPVASNLAEVIRPFSDLMSYQELLIEVHLPDRTVSKKTRAEAAISAMLGLVIATSACPHTHFFKPMARYHLPLSSIDETMFRMLGTYLTACYLNGKQTGTTDYDLTGLTTICRNMQILNASIANRLRDITTRDSTLGALVLLDASTMVMPFEIDESLQKLAGTFQAFLEKKPDTTAG